MRVLIADDDPVNRLVLRSMLGPECTRVLFAQNGQEAVERYRQGDIDIILMDVYMPVMDGYEAASRIKAECSDEFVPIIFVTGAIDDEALRRCIDSGGDDFITKPVNRVILGAKIASMRRIREMHGTLRRQTTQLESFQREMERDLDIAKYIFQNIGRSATREDGIQTWAVPRSCVSGDVLLIESKPGGGKHILVGDFTGHGLPAAVGALPLSEVFRAMTRKGHDIVAIAAEIGRKLHRLLPTGIFCSAALLDLDPQDRVVRVLNAGLPDVLIADRTGKLLQRLPSRNLPLGVASTEARDLVAEGLRAGPGVWAFVYTDGLIEATNAHGEMFGSERLERLFAGDSSAEEVFRRISEAVQEFAQGATQHDDVTLAAISYEAAARLEGDAASVPPSTVEAPRDWRLHLHCGPHMLRHFNPMPLLLSAIQELHSLERERERIYTVLAELYTNALEHGLLGLDSNLKHMPEGFMRYYDDRQARLETLVEGHIDFDMEFVVSAEGSGLRIIVTDSGPGFDHSRCLPRLEANESYSGRGISLVRALCDEVRYHGRGNRVEVTYSWGRNTE